MELFSESNDFCQVTLTSGYSIRAQKVIIATGGYGGYEPGYLRTRWLPITTSILVTSPLPQEVNKLLICNTHSGMTGVLGIISN